MTAIEPSLLLRVNYRVIDHLSTQHLQWARLTTTIALMHATTLQADAGWLRSTPEQRYRSLLKEHPGLVQRITQRDLASFLNITDVALSRIAKRVRGDALTVMIDDDSDAGDEDDPMAMAMTGLRAGLTLVRQRIASEPPARSQPGHNRAFDRGDMNSSSDDRSRAPAVRIAGVGLGVLGAVGGIAGWFTLAAAGDAATASAHAGRAGRRSPAPPASR